MRRRDRTIIAIQPRLLRMRDAPEYLGMSERVFNQIVRPNVREVVIGVQGVAFDREELDQWADTFMEENAVEKSERVDRSTRLDEPKQKHRAVTVKVTANPGKTSFQDALDVVRQKRKTSKVQRVD